MELYSEGGGEATAGRLAQRRHLPGTRTTLARHNAGAYG